MKSNVNKTDMQIKNDVLSELKFEPNVKATDIGVLVKDGTLTLNGFATSYGEKWDAIRAAKRVSGVKAIANDIEVKLPNSQSHTDSDIASAAASQIKWTTTIPMDTVKVIVSKGWVTLEGEVEWWSQKVAAESVIKYLMGVNGITNLISIKPRLNATGIETAITSAFERSALLDAKQIKVSTDGSAVTLTGEVRNYAEKEEAERVSYAAPGVYSVDNKLTVKWSVFGG